MCVYKQLFIVLNASRIAILLYTTSHTSINKRARILETRTHIIIIILYSNIQTADIMHIS